jgi:hypothetical protein
LCTVRHGNHGDRNQRERQQYTIRSSHSPSPNGFRFNPFFEWGVSTSNYLKHSSSTAALLDQIPRARAKSGFNNV